MARIIFERCEIAEQVCSHMQLNYRSLFREDLGDRTTFVFFVSIALDKNCDRNIWVTAASSKEEADHFRALIRLGNSELDSSCNFSCYVLSLKSNILQGDMFHASKLSSCLHVNARFYCRYIESSNKVPVSCLVQQKVFHSPNTEDLDALPSYKNKFSIKS
jgi:hypothetical protein